MEHKPFFLFVSYPGDDSATNKDNPKDVVIDSHANLGAISTFIEAVTTSILHQRLLDVDNCTLFIHLTVQDGLAIKDTTNASDVNNCTGIVTINPH